MPRIKFALGLALAGLLLLAGGCKSGSNSTPQGNPFAGDYGGTYSGSTHGGQGSENGTWTAVCFDDGSVTAQIASPSLGDVPGTGTITVDGLMTLTCSGTSAGGPYTITWQGTWQQSGSTATGSGTWTSTSADSGTWTGESPPPAS